MTLNLKELENKLKIHFKGSSVSLEDTVGDGAHFELNIVSDLFLNKSLIERHKMIYEVLGSIVGNESSPPPALPDESEIQWLTFE